MTTLTITARQAPAKTPLLKTLLACGAISSAVYVAINILVPLQWKAYNPVSQTISELSAIGAPTRKLWVTLCLIYSLLVVAFAVGIWLRANGRKKLYAIALSIGLYGAIGPFWPPMHQRQVLAANAATLTDTLHLVFSAVTVLLMIIAIVVSIATFKAKLRLYCIITLVILLAFGTLTGLDAPKVAANMPTPLLGIWERINVGTFMLWMAILSVVMLTDQPKKE